MTEELKQKITKLKELTLQYQPFLHIVPEPLDENRIIRNMTFAHNCKNLILDIIKDIEQLETK